MLTHGVCHRRRNFLLIVAGLALPVFGIVLGRNKIRRPFFGLLRWFRGNGSVADRLKEYGPSVRERFEPRFLAADVTYPPTRILLAAFKAERRLNLYAADSTDQLRFITAYPVLAESGVLGPKLLEDDRQVPEGSYVIDSLNPNSLFHLSLHVSYPSAFDREMAQRDGRTRLGGDIMIHGGSSSVGCLAVGDQAIEDLFVLSATVGLGHVSILISPVDFRKQQLPQDTLIPSWSELLYEPLRIAIQRLPTAFPVGSPPR